MCGITAILCHTGDASVYQSLQAPLARRGPDGSSTHLHRFPAASRALQLTGHVLHLRGAAGPTLQPRASPAGALLFNGQIYAGLEGLEPAASDTLALEAALAAASAAAEPEQAVLGVFGGLRGPWAVIWWDCVRHQLWFARDVLGRRSLCVSTDQADASIVVASVCGCSGTWVEVPALGVFRLRIDAESGAVHCGDIFPWRMSRSGEDSVASGFDNFRTLLSPISLAFCDAAAALSSPLPPVNLDRGTFDEGNVQAFARVLTLAVARRASMFANSTAIPAVAVLFSGGVDSTVLALLLHRVLPPQYSIDLINVAFENARRADFDDQHAFDVPDRLTGTAALGDLQRLAPERDWRFVAVDVRRDELEAERARIRQLVKPLRTELDDSLGCALWFAARGQGRLLGHEASYTSTAPVLLVGSGADEQLGGYSRHRVAFAKGGHDLLGQEIAMDVARLWSRNMGRDDRIIADLSKDARFPFLDEDVVSFLSTLPLEAKMDLALPRGVGEKRLLRALAKELGLVTCVALPKRALQFGSRIAKMASGRVKGSDIIGEE